MGTIMMSPNGLRWSVLHCEVVTQYIPLLTIELCGGEFPLLENDAKTEDIQFIDETIQWPTRLWKIESVPGFETTKKVTYLDQHIPTMLHAKVPSSWTENEMIFGL